MLRGVLLFALVLALPAFAVERVADDPERDWIHSRNDGHPSIHYPAAFGLAPERLDAQVAGPEWSFWTEEWSKVSREWARGIYVTLKLTEQERFKAARNELQYLEMTLARLNVLANQVVKPSPHLNDALTTILAEGIRRGAVEAGVAQELHLAKYRGILSSLVSYVEDDKRLARATRQASREWKLYDGGAHDERAFQSILGAGAVTYGVYSWSLVGYEHFAPAALAGLATLFVANTAGRFLLPLTTRFRWHENRIREPLATCETALINAPKT